MHNSQNSCCGGKNSNSGTKGAIDPVCKMTVDPATAKNSLDHNGTKYYFCCSGCLRKFAAAPEQYLKK